MKGYTYKILYTRTIPSGPLKGMRVPSDFRTSDDAVQLSVEALERNSECSDVRVEVIE